jgi:PAS domain S-box-containing protein
VLLKADINTVTILGQKLWHSTHKIKKAVEGRQTAGALKESEHELKVLFKRMINAFVLFESVFDNNGTVVSFRFVFINDAYERITGVKNDEVLGKTLHEVWPGTEASWIKAYGDVAVTGVPSSFEMYHEPTKKLYYCNVYRPGDSQDRICVIFDDITERKQAEVAIAESEKKFRAIFDAAQDGMLIADIETRRFVMANKAMLELTRYRETELLNLSVPDIIPLANLPSSIEQFEKQVRREISLSSDIPIQRKDGTVFFADITSSMVTLNGRQCTLGIFRDVTERKASEQALTKSQNQLADAMDLAHMANWEFDVASAIFTFNDRFYAMYGTTAEREGGYQMPAEVYAREFVHPDEVDVVAQEVQNAITATDPNYTRQIEHRIIRRGGEIRHIIVRFRITKDARGRTVKTHGANQDITDRIEAEESIRLSRVFLDRVIDMSPFAMWISDKEGTVVRVNRALCETINVAPDLIVGRYNVLKDVNLEKQGVMPDVKAVFEKHKQARFTIPWKAADAGDTGLLAARDMYIDVAIFPILDAHGNLTNVICQWVDITDRKQIEHALRESEERYRVIVEDQTEFICRFTPDGRLTFVNDAYCRYFSLDKDRCLARPHSVILPPEDVQQMNQHLASLTPQNPVATIEHRIIMPTGEVRWQRWNDRAIFDQNSNVVEYQSVGRDITKYKLADEALQTKERQLSSIFNNVSEILFFVSVEPDLRYRFISVNQRFLDATGLLENQVAGRYVDEVIPEPSLSLVLENYKQAIREHKTVRWFEVTPYPSGTKYGHIAVTPIFDGNNRCTNLIGSVHDITELKIAEEDLRISEERYRSFTESSPDQIFIINRDDTLQYVNLQAAKLFNLPLDQILGKPRASLFPPEIATAQGVLLKKVFETGKPLRQEETIRFGNVTLWIDTSFVPLKDEKGNVHSVLGVSRDITERKRAEEALQKERDFANSVVETMQAIVIILDTEGHIVQINPYMEEISGYTLEEVKGKDWFKTFLRPDNRESTRSLFRKALGDIQTIGNVDVIITKDGHERLIEWYDKTLKGADGSVTGLLAIGQDVTERKKIQDALHASEIRYRRLFETAQDAILILDGETGAIIDANPFILDMLGYPIESFIGKQLWELGFVKDKSLAQHAFDELKTKGYVRYEDLPLETKDGRSFNVEFVSNVYRVNHHKII